LSIKIATAQIRCKLGDVKANLSKMEKMANAVRKREVDIVCFPELVTCGYSLFEKWIDVAETIPGPTTTKLGRIANELGLYLIAGMSERDQASNRIYNSAVLIGPHGDLVGVYRKVHLWDMERKYFTPGDQFPVFNTRIGTIGMAICYDLEFPESSRIMAIKGAQILFFPSAEMRPFEKQVDIYLQSRASENGVFVVFSNRVGREGKTVFFGRSQIVSPACRVLARVAQTQQVAVASIRLTDISRERKRLPYIKQRVPKVYAALTEETVRSRKDEILSNQI
jgi:predicted amidohydrolase